MPLGIERINVRRRSPNALINFLTPLPGADHAVAQDYLERIAAIVYPIMKSHGLAVMTLDEFPANLEFWGRNFNAGECIQLVLKHPSTGAWLPFRFVAGVMIHELAHIHQMNHSSAFWALKDAYSAELRALQDEGYTGEGFWSRGRVLLSERLTEDRPLAEAEMPKHICGGTFRSRGRKRRGKQKEPLSYAEQKKRRIEKKFGVDGKKVGGDTDDGKPKPRVAQSKRGRELRAAAALKRFEKKEEEEVKAEGSAEADDKDEAASESDDDEKTVNVGGGRFLVAVSGPQDGIKEEEDMDRELLELLGGVCGPAEAKTDPDIAAQEGIKKEEESDRVRPEPSPTAAEQPVSVPPATSSARKPSPLVKSDPVPSTPRTPPFQPTPVIRPRTPSICDICTSTNPSSAPICAACLHVLDPSLPHWTCCLPAYRNSSDVSFCGICGGRRPSDK